MPAILRAVCAAVLLLVLPLLAAGEAAAHAQLVASEPADGTVVAAPPTILRLTFNEPVSPLVLRLVEPDGRSADLTGARGDGASLIVPLSTGAAAGTRLVSWRVVSTDGHPVGGTLTFSVGAPTAAPTAAATATDALPLWIFRAVVALSLAFGVGGAVFAAFVAPIEASARRVAALLLAAGAAALCLAVAAEGRDALGGGDILAVASWRAGLAARYAATAGLAGVALLAGAIALAAAGPGLRRSAAALAWLAAAAAPAASGHAGSVEPQWLTRGAVGLHAAAVIWWLGALPPLAAAIAAGRSDLAATLHRFSRVAVPAVAALALTGTGIAIVQLETPAALWNTGYGQVLTVKLLVVAALLALAVANRLWLTPAVAAGSQRARPRLAATVAAEIVLAVVLLGVVGLWRQTPPPRALAAAAAQGVAVHVHGAAAMADVTLLPGRTGTNHLSIAVRDGSFAPLAAKGLTVAFSRPDAGIEAVEREARLGADGRWTADGFVLPIAGRWLLTIDVLVDDFHKESLEAPVEIGR